MTTGTVLDPNAIAELRSLNPGDNDEFLREIAGIFLDDTPQRIAELDQSLAAGDAPKFTRAAHSIKGSSSNLGATGLRAVAEDLETRARAEGLRDVRELIVQLKAEFVRTQTALDALLGRQG
jgi:HPt (histidine-containing phosphotransfer) domain-containing protein